MKTTKTRLSVMLLLFQTTSFALGALYARRALTEENTDPLWMKGYDGR